MFVGPNYRSKGHLLAMGAFAGMLLLSGEGLGQYPLGIPSAPKGSIPGIVLVKVSERPNEPAMFWNDRGEYATSLGPSALSELKACGLSGMRVVSREGNVTIYALMFNSEGKESEVIAYLERMPTVIQATRDYPLTFLAEPNDTFYQPDSQDYSKHWVPNAANYYLGNHIVGRECPLRYNSVFWCCCEAPCSMVTSFNFHAKDSIHVSDQWYLQRARVNKAWDIEKGQDSVKILVIDSGIDVEHPDLAAHIWDNSAVDGKWDMNHDGLPGGCCGFNNPILDRDIDGDVTTLFGSDHQCDCGPDGDYGFGPNAIDDDPPGPGGGDDDLGPKWADNPRGPGSQHPEIPFNDDRDDIVFMRCDDDANGYPDDTHGLNTYDLIQDFGIGPEYGLVVPDGLPGAKDWGDGDIDKDGYKHFNDPEVKMADFDQDGVPLSGLDDTCDAGPDGDYGFGPNGVDDPDENGILGPGGGDDDPGPKWADNTKGPGTPRPFDDDMEDVYFLRYDSDEDGNPFEVPRDNSCPKEWGCHGTQMAGIIGAVTNNLKGVAGYAWNCTLIPAKVAVGYPEQEYDRFPPRTRNLSAALVRLKLALAYALEKHVDVVNMSLGNYADSNSNFLDDQELQAKVTQCHSAGIVLVAGAGNLDETTYVYPASLDSVISVSGATRFEHKAVYVNYNRRVDVCAPIGDAYSEPDLGRGTECATTGYISNPATMFGWWQCDYGCHTYVFSPLQTSGATAEVSGLAALLVSFYPKSRVQEMFPSSYSNDFYANFIEGEIKRGCIPMPNEPHYTAGDLGAGRVDAFRSLTQWGTISEDAIWNDRVYVSGDLTIAPGKTLTIEPGTIVYFMPEDDQDSGIDPSRVAFEVQGTLIAEGTTQNPIIFKGFGENPAPESWYGIWFKQNSSGSLAYCKIENARYGLKHDSTIQIDSCEVVWDQYAHVWRDLTIDQGLTLTVNPGTTVYFAPEDSAHTTPDTSRVALSVKGVLNANGTANNRVTFISDSEEEHFPGAWFGIYFSDENASGTLSHCKIQDARYGVVSKTTIHIADCEIMNCLTAGVYMWDTLSAGDVVNNSSTIERCNIHFNPNGAGMRIWNCPDTVHVETDTVTYNDVGIWVSNARPRITSCIMSGNGNQGLWVTSYRYPTPYPYPDVEWCHMQGNGAEGIKCEYNAADVSYSKSWQNGTYGLLATGEGAYPSMDHSKVIDNPSAGVRVNSGAHVVLGIAGIGSTGYNSIYGSQTKNVYNATTTAVYAQNCWWGSNPPNTSKFQGQVIYTPYLTSDPVYYLAPAKPKMPTVLTLEQNFPNPFNGMTGATTIKYSIPSQNERVVLRVYDVTGRRVRTLVDKSHLPGYYSVRWDGRNDRGKRVAPGVYFCQMDAGRQSFTKKMVLFR